MLLNIQDDTAGCSASLKVKEGPPKLLLYPQAAWSWMSRQQEDELTALKEVVAGVRAFGVVGVGENDELVHHFGRFSLMASSTASLDVRRGFQPADFIFSIEY